MRNWINHPKLGNSFPSQDWTFRRFNLQANKHPTAQNDLKDSWVGSRLLLELDGEAASEAPVSRGKQHSVFGRGQRDVALGEQIAKIRSGF